MELSVHRTVEAGIMTDLAEQPGAATGEIKAEQVAPTRACGA